jgi:hypothetical protein
VSQYVESEVAGISVAELQAALEALGLVSEHATRSDGMLMLEDCLESAGRPVHLRLEAGILDTAEDFGFLTDGGRVRLVCGDIDRNLLSARLLAPLHANIVEARLGVHAGLRVESPVSVDDSDEVLIRVTED